MTRYRAERLPHDVDVFIRNALREDIGTGDVTTLSTIPGKHFSSASLLAKESFVIAGLPFAERTFRLIDKNVQFKALKKEGSRVKRGDIIAGIKGSTRSILTAERVMLNLLQRLCGIATLTDSFVKRVKGLEVRITDTRKTAPGMRYFDKYAVKAGGGQNHRFGLYDGILIKDNHIEAAGGIVRAVELARAKACNKLKVEIETSKLPEVRQAIAARADIIMLDNMSLDKMRKAVELIRKDTPDVTIEASGNVDLRNVRAIAGTGVDLISIGALTHSARAADISLMIISL